MNAQKVEHNRVFNLRNISLVFLAISAPLNMNLYSQEYEEKEAEYGFVEAFPEIHAFFRTDYFDFEKDGERGGIATFDPYGIYFMLGSQLRQNLWAIGEWEFEHGGDKIKLTRVIAKWEISKSFQIKIGKEFLPFGIGERVYYSPPNLRKFIFHPFVLRVIVPMSWRDTGVFLSGVLPISEMKLVYNFGIVNGLGDQALSKIRKARQNRDNNSPKSIIGRVVFVPMGGVEIGGSYNSGKYDDDAKYNINHIGGHIIYDRDPFNIVGEYITSAVENSAADINRSGFYIAAGLKLFQKRNFENLIYIEPVVRFDSIDPDDSVSDNNDQSRISVGLIISPYEHFKFRVEYHVITEKSDPKLANNGFAANVTIDF